MRKHAQQDDYRHSMSQIAQHLPSLQQAAHRSSPVRMSLAPVTCAVLLTVFIVLYVSDRPIYFTTLNALHEHPYTTPFLDTRFVTAQAECWARGIDVYAYNPCDPLGRTHDYSPLWLRLSFLARSDSWTPLFGLVIDLLFIVALFVMPWECANLFSRLVIIGAAGSYDTVFAAERGNTDLLMFAGSVLFWRLLCGSAMARSAGYLVVLVIGLLKSLLRNCWRRADGRMGKVRNEARSRLMRLSASFSRLVLWPFPCGEQSPGVACAGCARRRRAATRRGSGRARAC